ncbi:MAG TPA: hypothetical protein P5044_05390 [bacterium]|nr:hypothetical protein [bacterium]
MKKFYAVMISMLALIVGQTGCLTVEYGTGPENYDNDPAQDEDTVINDDIAEDADIVNDADTPAMEYGPVQTDYDTADDDADGNPVIDAEYGPPPADYDSSDDSDEIVTNDDPAMEYGPVQTDYDETPDENPDEMTTDYGPISTKFHK